MTTETMTDRQVPAVAEPSSRPPVARRRRLLKLAGWGFVALGAVGAVLPLLPTTIFLIAAVACFMRADPVLAQRLLDHPRYGPPLVAWRDRGAVSRKGKIAAITAMAAGLGLSWALGAPALVLAATGAILVPVAIWLAARPER
ncbi:YbaN family protein [Tistrella bauzanensis]|uniref:YbaN family protein n=1 Tax=Tistrella arctica TaxID=3133430 RepID=A0ABU9YG06_9PROT